MGKKTTKKYPKHKNLSVNFPLWAKVTVHKTVKYHSKWIENTLKNIWETPTTGNFDEDELFHLKTKNQS